MARTRFFDLPNVPGLDAYEELRRQRAYAYYGIPAMDQVAAQQHAAQQVAANQPHALQALPAARELRPRAR